LHRGIARDLAAEYAAASCRVTGMPRVARREEIIAEVA